MLAFLTLLDCLAAVPIQAMDAESSQLELVIRRTNSCHKMKDPVRDGSRWKGVCSILTFEGGSGCPTDRARRVLPSLNAEEGIDGIRSICISPGEVETPILDTPPSSPSAAERQLMLQPEDVAETALFCVRLLPRACATEVVLLPTDDCHVREHARAIERLPWRSLLFEPGPYGCFPCTDPPSSTPRAAQEFPNVHWRGTCRADTRDPPRSGRNLSFPRAGPNVSIWRDYDIQFDFRDSWASAVFTKFSSGSALLTRRNH